MSQHPPILHGPAESVTIAYAFMRRKTGQKGAKNKTLGKVTTENAL